MPHHKKVLNQHGEQALCEVVTIAEAARLWHYHHTTFRYAVDSGNVAARKSGNIWLISVSSIIAYYGRPQYLPSL